MATYYIRTNKKSGKARLYSKVRQAGLNLFYSTGVEVDIEKWNKSKQSKQDLLTYKNSMEGNRVFSLLGLIDKAVKELVLGGKVRSKDDLSIIKGVVTEIISEEKQEEMAKPKKEKTKVLYPIAKKYVKRIFDGSKAYEFRRSFCSPDVDTIVIYESQGRGKVVGECQIVGRICCSPYKLWNLTKEYAGIEEKDFFKYFEGCDKACAYVIGDVNIFLKPRELSEYGIDFAPQNYFYVKQK